MCIVWMPYFSIGYLKHYYPQWWCHLLFSLLPRTLSCQRKLKVWIWVLQLMQGLFIFWLVRDPVNVMVEMLTEKVFRAAHIFIIFVGLKIFLLSEINFCWWLVSDLHFKLSQHMYSRLRFVCKKHKQKWPVQISAVICKNSDCIWCNLKIFNVVLFLK